MHAINRIEFEGSPPPWGVTAIGGFVQAAMARADREGGELPSEFYVSFCPWGKRNAAFQHLAPVVEVIEPRFRLVHFTSCGRPYLIAILTGPDSATRQNKVKAHLPWSEHYRASREGDQLTLTLVDEVEDIDVEPPASLGERSLRQLFSSGELGDF